VHQKISGADFADPKTIKTGIQRTKLANGLQVVTSNTPSKLSTVSLALPVGSRDESGHHLGVVSILRHLGFTSSVTRSSLAIYRESEELGFSLRCNAGREFLTYSLQNFMGNSCQAVSLLEEVVFSPKFAEHEIRDVKASLVKDVLEDYASNICQQILEAVHASAYGQFSPLGRSFYLPLDILVSDKASFQSFAHQYFTVNGATLIGTNVEHQELVERASNLAYYVSTRPLPQRASSTYQGGDHRVLARLPLVHMGFAFNGASASSADRLKLDIFQEVVLARAAHDQELQIFNINYSDNGLFGVTTVAKEANVQHKIDQIAHLLKSAANFSNPEFEIAKTRAFLKKSMDLEHDDVLTRSVADGTYVENLSNAIGSITLEDVRAVATKVLNSRVSFASIGNPYSVPSYDVISKKFK